MKATILKSIVFVATTALTLSSCEKEIRNAASVEEVKITVKATADDLGNVADTKTYINSDKQILWGENEQMTIAVIAGENQSIADSDAISDFDGESQAMFTFSITPGEAEQYTYCGMYPAAAKADNNIDATKFKVILPDTQSATGSSYDPKAYILISRPEVFNTVQTDWIASYRRATALNKITLTGLSEDIVSVEITVPEGIDLAGRRYFNLTTGHSGDVYFGKTNSVKVNYVSALTGTSKDVWFTSWESNIPAGGKLTIKATSTAHTYTRTITARESGISFHEGNLNLLSVNMAADDVVVEDLNSLAGNYIIVSRHIVNNNPSGYWVYMSGTSTTFYSCENTTLSATEAIDITSSSISFSSVSDYWIVEKNGNNYSIKNFATGKFVGYANDGSNSASALNDAYALSISPDANTPGIYEIGSVESSDRVLRYNGSSPRFAFYKGTQNKIYLIPYVQAQQYTVSISSNIVNGSVTANKEMACAGETVTLTATPADNYKLQAWDVKDADNNTITVTDNSFIMPAKAVTVSATFEVIPKHTFTIATCENGSVSASINGIELKSNSEVGEGIVITISADPENGYQLASWSVKDASNNDISVTDNAFIMPASDVTVSAIFEKESSGGTYVMTIDSSAAGVNNVHWTTSDTESLTYDGVSWYTSIEGTSSITASKTYCQIGSKSNPAKKIVLSSADFAGKTIKSVTVNCYCMSNTGPALTVTAGSTTLINNVALTKTTATDISYTGDGVTLGNSDNLVITFNSTASAAICISKIEVTYE